MRTTGHLINRLSMGVKRPTLKTGFYEVKPSFNVERVLDRLLLSVPENYLVNLQEITLSNACELPRERKRERTKGGNAVLDVRGVYHMPWRGEGGRIELFVDNIVEGWPKLLLAIPFFQNLILFQVLYHEIGHHVQILSKTNRTYSEIRADQVTKELARIFIRQRYWWLLPLLNVANYTRTFLRRGITLVRRK